MSAWTTRPGDPWQLDAGPPDASGLVTASTLLAAFAPSGALEPGADPERLVAVGLLDQWTEVVPAVDHTTTVAFHHDAPGARAPQAVLVAVPPTSTPISTARPLSPSWARRGPRPAPGRQCRPTSTPSRPWSRS